VLPLATPLGTDIPRPPLKEEMLPVPTPPLPSSVMPSPAFCSAVQSRTVIPRIPNAPADCLIGASLHPYSLTGRGERRRTACTDGRPNNAEAVQIKSDVVSGDLNRRSIDVGDGKVPR
jgi:hypothetical protein